MAERPARLNGGVEVLLREEVALLLATLGALSVLTLGVLELIWPTRSSQRPSAPRLSPVSSPEPAPRASHAATAAPPPPTGPSRPAPDAAAAALRIGQTLLKRALEESAGTTDRRLAMIHAAVAALNRGLEAAPGDVRLREALGTAREALWATYQRIALDRLAADMPWGATALAGATSGSPGGAPAARR